MDSNRSDFGRDYQLPSGGVATEIPTGGAGTIVWHEPDGKIIVLTHDGSYISIGIDGIIQISPSGTACDDQNIYTIDAPRVTVTAPDGTIHEQSLEGGKWNYSEGGPSIFLDSGGAIVIQIRDGTNYEMAIDGTIKVTAQNLQSYVIRADTKGYQEDILPSDSKIGELGSEATSPPSVSDDPSAQQTKESWSPPL